MVKGRGEERGGNGNWERQMKRKRGEKKEVIKGRYDEEKRRRKMGKEKGEGEADEEKGTKRGETREVIKRGEEANGKE